MDKMRIQVVKNTAKMGQESRGGLSSTKKEARHWQTECGVIMKHRRGEQREAHMRKSKTRTPSMWEKSVALTKTLAFTSTKLGPGGAGLLASLCLAYRCWPLGRSRWVVPWFRPVSLGHGCGRRNARQAVAHAPIGILSSSGLRKQPVFKTSLVTLDWRAT